MEHSRHAPLALTDFRNMAGGSAKSSLLSILVGRSTEPTEAEVEAFELQDGARARA